MKRKDSIDFLRGLAVVSMFITHSVLFTAPKSDNPVAWWVTVNLSGDWGAGLFAFLLGFSLSISIDRHRAEGMTERALGIRTLKRAGALFVVGFFFPILLWGIYDGLYWDAITMLAASIATLWLLRNAKPYQFFVVAAAIVLAAPFVFKGLHGPEHWHTGNYKAHPTPLNLLGGFLGTGYFPLFPWMCFSLVGFGVGRAKASTRSLLATAFLLAAAGWALSLLRTVVAPSSIGSAYARALRFYPLSVPSVLIILSIVLMLFATSHAVLDTADHPRPWMDLFRTFSRYSLTLYIVHFAVLILPQQLGGWLATRDHESLLRNTLTVRQGLVLGPALTTLFYGVCRVWERAKGRYSLEWWLSRIY